MGACVLNKRRERRQNDMGMRVERLHKVMESEYACHLRGILMCRNKGNILRDLWIRIKRDIRILCFEGMYAATDTYCP